MVKKHRTYAVKPGTRPVLYLLSVGSFVMRVDTGKNLCPIYVYAVSHINTRGPGTLAPDSANVHTDLHSNRRVFKQMQGSNDHVNPLSCYPIGKYRKIL